MCMYVRVCEWIVECMRVVTFLFVLDALGVVVNGLNLTGLRISVYIILHTLAGYAAIILLTRQINTLETICKK